MACSPSDLRRTARGRARGRSPWRSSAAALVAAACAGVRRQQRRRRRRELGPGRRSRCRTATPTSRPRSSRPRSRSGTPQNPTMKVNLVFNGGNDSALQKTVAGFTAGNYPDVAYEYGSSAAQLARQPKLVDLTAKVNAPGDGLERLLPLRARRRRRSTARSSASRPSSTTSASSTTRSCSRRPASPADGDLDLAGLPRRRQEADERLAPTPTGGPTSTTAARTPSGASSPCCGRPAVTC